VGGAYAMPCSASYQDDLVRFKASIGGGRRQRASPASSGALAHSQMVVLANAKCRRMINPG
jgi:hypothetical protein